ncbi:carboxypeptidase regulatory-like domain-containing protein [bacterium AH-315-B15]|nr:carboxypeptidase regulatory-like domain-containing protein [bacterium AH-315-B15]
MKTLFITTLFFASTAMYAQSEVSTCDCEEFTSEEHCALILCGSMEGTVTEGTAPVSCACVKVYKESTLLYATKTAADGTYTIPNLIMGTFTVLITKGTTVAQP